LAIIALVGCGKTKLTYGAPAQDLYTGDLFRKARAFAEKHADRWYILSAKHGLVSPKTYLHPYDLACADLSPVEREVWEMDVRREIRRRAGPGDTLVFLAGECYAGIVSGFPNVEKPLQGLGIGHRKAWLKRNT
jgi:hypothetical protein